MPRRVKNGVIPKENSRGKNVQYVSNTWAICYECPKMISERLSHRERCDSIHHAQSHIGDGQKPPLRQYRQQSTSVRLAPSSIVRGDTRTKIVSFCHVAAVKQNGRPSHKSRTRGNFQSAWNAPATLVKKKKKIGDWRISIERVRPSVRCLVVTSKSRNGLWPDAGRITDDFGDGSPWARSISR